MQCADDEALKVHVWDYEFVSRIRTNWRSPFPLDMTSLPCWPHQTGLLRCRERRGAAWMSAQSISKSQPRQWLTGGEVTSVFTLIEIHEIVRGKKKILECKMASHWIAKQGEKRNRKHNAWIDRLIQEEDGIHKCINIEIQFWSQIESFVRARFSFDRGKERHFLFNHERLQTDMD